MKPAEEYILNQPEPYVSMLLHLQLVVEHTLPDAELKYKWRIPCYFVGKSPICYLNVSTKKRYLDVGFWNGANLTKHLDKMIKDKRKIVRSLRYTSIEDIDDVILIAILKEAYSVRRDGFSF